MKAISFAIAKGLEDAYNVMTHSQSPQESHFEDRGRSFSIKSDRIERKMRYTLSITEGSPYEVWKAMEIRDVDGVSMVYGDDFAPKYLLVTSGGIEISFDINQRGGMAPPSPCRPMVPHKPKCEDHCKRDKHCKPQKPQKPHHCDGKPEPFPFPMTPVPLDEEEEAALEDGWATL